MDVSNCSTIDCASLSQRSTAVRATEFAIALLITVLALLGNILVCITIKRKKDLQSVTHKFICSLAVADSLTATISIIFGVPGQLLGYWAFPDTMCPMDGFFNLYFYTVSIYHLMLISLTRYTQVVQPASHEKIFQSQRTYLLLVAAWTLPLVLSLLPFFGVGHYEWSSSFLCCFIDKDVKFMLLFAIVGLSIPLLIITYTYTALFISVRKHQRKVFPSTSNASLNMEIKVAKMAFIVVAVFMILWLPSVLTASFEAAKLKLPHIWYVINVDLILLSSAVNPLIYAAMNTTIRKGLMETLAVVRDNLRRVCIRKKSRRRTDIIVQ